MKTLSISRIKSWHKIHLGGKTCKINFFKVLDTASSMIFSAPFSLCFFSYFQLFFITFLFFAPPESGALGESEGRVKGKLKIYILYFFRLACKKQISKSIGLFMDPIILFHRIARYRSVVFFLMKLCTLSKLLKYKPPLQRQNWDF